MAWPTCPWPTVPPLPTWRRSTARPVASSRSMRSLWTTCAFRADRSRRCNWSNSTARRRACGACRGRNRCSAIPWPWTWAKSKLAWPGQNAPRTALRSAKSARRSTTSSNCSPNPWPKRSAAWKAKAVVVWQWAMPTRPARSTTATKARPIPCAMVPW
ncbi:hypothetical protein D3C79_783220 [compost metagenome]